MHNACQPTKLLHNPLCAVLLYLHRTSKKKSKPDSRDICDIPINKCINAVLMQQIRHKTLETSKPRLWSPKSTPLTFIKFLVSWLKFLETNLNLTNPTVLDSRHPTTHISSQKAKQLKSASKWKIAEIIWKKKTKIFGGQLPVAQISP